MGGKIAMILFGVLALGIVIFLVHANFLKNLTSPLGSLFHYNASKLFGAATSSISSATGTSVVVKTTSSSPSTPHNGAGSAHNTVTSQTVPAPTTTIPASQIPAGFTLAQLSPYFKKITIGSAYAGYGSSYGEISLSSYGLSASSTVDITGWQIKTNRGGEYIPQAIGLYDPSGLTAASDIFLGEGQYVYIYSSPGPFNLRLNECIGYIANSNKFTPSLPDDCPSVNQSAISAMGFTGACESYIYSLGSCRVPNLNNAPIPQNDYACRDYISNNFNYKACFDAHESDPRFLSNQWWVWTGSTPLDRYHDVVNLFDKSGLLVDEYKY
jgi:hypothetical protein